MALSDFLFGESEQFKQVDRFTPEQKELIGQLLQGLGGPQQQGLGFLSSLFGDTSQFEAPFMRQFQEETIPGIAERFSALGAQGSSAFGQQLGKAGAGLQEQLASLKGQLGLQGLSALQGLSGQALQPQFESVYQQRQPGFLESMFSEVVPGLGAALGQQAGQSGNSQNIAKILSQFAA